MKEIKSLYKVLKKPLSTPIWLSFDESQAWILKLKKYSLYLA